MNVCLAPALAIFHTPARLLCVQWFHVPGSPARYFAPTVQRVRRYSPNHNREAKAPGSRDPSISAKIGLPTAPVFHGWERDFAAAA
jgi:hypothetical protein